MRFFTLGFLLASAQIGSLSAQMVDGFCTQHEGCFQWTANKVCGCDGCGKNTYHQQYNKYQDKLTNCNDCTVRVCLKLIPPLVNMQCLANEGQYCTDTNKECCPSADPHFEPVDMPLSDPQCQVGHPGDDLTFAFETQFPCSEGEFAWGEGEQFKVGCSEKQDTDTALEDCVTDMNIHVCKLKVTVPDSPCGHYDEAPAKESSGDDFTDVAYDECAIEKEYKKCPVIKYMLNDPDYQKSGYSKSQYYHGTAGGHNDGSNYGSQSGRSSHGSHLSGSVHSHSGSHSNR
jgi:hypothetical protein